ncbi:SETMAR [Cordylochernes scorpioides]|uniref:SETMAR n=1 Tax=Cordylochernes scorpioides TaxID=51811 RepID=A0ABY6K2L3_9ARAC|nr:SETMAR [Cordylochernes scorpioides]
MALSTLLYAAPIWANNQRNLVDRNIEASEMLSTYGEVNARQFSRQTGISYGTDRQALNEITFMQDGGPPHISCGAKHLLKDTFGEYRVISRHFIYQWPPRSPDLTPCDVYRCRAYHRAAQKWFSKFKNGDMDPEDTPRSGRPSEFDEKHLKALLKKDGRQTTRDTPKPRIKQDLHPQKAMICVILGLRRYTVLGNARKSHVPLDLQEMHSSPKGGHIGIGKTLAKARERFCWPESRAVVENWCRNCSKCSARKIKETGINIFPCPDGLRKSEHESTGYSPAGMLFGHEPRMPCDVLLGCPEETFENTSTSFNGRKDDDHSPIYCGIYRDEELIPKSRRTKLRGGLQANDAVSRGWTTAYRRRRSTFWKILEGSTNFCLLFCACFPSLCCSCVACALHMLINEGPGILPGNITEMFSHPDGHRSTRLTNAACHPPLATPGMDATQYWHIAMLGLVLLLLVLAAPLLALVCLLVRHPRVALVLRPNAPTLPPGSATRATDVSAPPPDVVALGLGVSVLLADQPFLPPNVSHAQRPRSLSAIILIPEDGAKFFRSEKTISL